MNYVKPTVVFSKEGRKWKNGEKKMRVDEEIDGMEVRLRERRKQGKGVRIRGRKERGKENQDMCIFLGDRKLFPGGSNEHHSGNGGRNC